MGAGTDGSCVSLAGVPWGLSSLFCSSQPTASLWDPNATAGSNTCRVRPEASRRSQSRGGCAMFTSRGGSFVLPRFSPLESQSLGSESPVVYLMGLT